jgi:uncharacterized repeat protein (TIGR01451 family)
MAYARNLTTRAALFAMAGLMLAIGGCHDDLKETDPLGFEHEQDEEYLEMHYPTGRRGTSVITVRYLGPEWVNAGESYDARIVAENLTELTLQDVKVYLRGEQLSLNNATPSPDTQNGWHVFTLGQFQPGQERTIRLNGVTDEVGDLRQCLAVAYLPGFCFDTAVVEADIAVQRGLNVAADQIVAVCDPVEATYVVRNTGTGIAEHVRLKDELPEGLRTARGSRQMSRNIGTLQPNESKRVTVTLKAEKSGDYELSPAVATGANDLRAEASAATISFRKPALDLTLDSAGRAYVGNTVAYTTEVTNTGDMEARDFTIEQTLRGPTQVVRISGGGQLTDGNRVVWRPLPLEPGESTEVFIEVEGAAKGTMETNVAADAYCATEVSESASTEVIGIAALLLEVVDTTDPVSLGDVVEYRITVTNQGSKAGRNIEVVTTLPERMSYQGASAGAQRDGRTVTFSIGNLAAGDQTTVTVRGVAETAGDVRFRTEMTSDTLTEPVRETESTKLYSTATEARAQ